MKKFLRYSVLIIACFLFLEMPTARGGFGGGDFTFSMKSALASDR